MASSINASTSAGLVSTADTSGVLQLQAANTTVLNAELGKALALQGASSTTGCGIAFPATQVTSTDANTLDDYEEGTWTPSVGGTATYTTQAGTYVKIGRVVYFSGYLVISVIGTGSQITISGLPFTSTTTTDWVSNAGVSSSATNIVSNYVFCGGTSLTFYSRTAASASPSNPAIMQSGSTVDVNGFYFTTT
jgi:hypothetical protein